MGRVALYVRIVVSKSYIWASQANERRIMKRLWLPLPNSFQSFPLFVLDSDKSFP